MDAPIQSLAAARAAYLAKNGWTEADYESRYVYFKAYGFLPVIFPNWEGRRKAVRIHDLHHALTGYGTDPAGEAEVAAFELASGCKNFWAAWFLDSVALSWGLVVAPRRTARAFLRGRRCKNLYGTPISAELLARSLVELRKELGLCD